MPQERHRLKKTWRDFKLSPQCDLWQRDTVQFERKPIHTGQEREFDFQGYSIIRRKCPISNNNSNENNHKEKNKWENTAHSKKQNKSTEIIPEESQVLDNDFKTIVSKMFKEFKKDIKTESWWTKREYQ